MLTIQPQQLLQLPVPLIALNLCYAAVNSKGVISNSTAPTINIIFLFFTTNLFSDLYFGAKSHFFVVHRAKLYFCDFFWST